MIEQIINKISIAHILGTLVILELLVAIFYKWSAIYWKDLEKQRNKQLDHMFDLQKKQEVLREKLEELLRYLNLENYEEKGIRPRKVFKKQQ